MQSGEATPFAEVIGDPISQSKSPLIHNFWIEQLGLNARYGAVHVRPDALADYVSERRSMDGWRGANITIPHKLAVMDLVNDPGDVRGTIGAMNTIIRQPDDSIIGTNTDAAGFYAPIADIDLRDAAVAVIGTGGAARAVLFALARAGVGAVTLLSRSPLKASGLLAHFSLNGRAIALGERLPTAGLLINASPLGMVGQAPLTIDLSPLADGAIVYDLVYAPLVTDLLAAADERGLTTIDGLDMLVGQAALAFELFFGAPPPRDRDDELRAALLI